MLEETRRRLGEEHAETLSAMNNLAEMLRPQGKNPQGVQGFLAALWKSLKAAFSRAPAVVR
ncbi:hypothetical protein [Archangium sp.]|uniref:hypothetical protein n=1 Tax=Archangium sp. TaxID=1872627 RepID=UPI00389A5655